MSSLGTLSAAERLGADGALAAVTQSTQLAAAQLLLRGELQTVTITGQDGTSVAFDAVLSESHDDLVDITQLPVESGYPVTDHVRPEPAVISISGILSDTPIAYAGAMLGEHPDANTRYAQLQRMVQSRQLMALSTPRRQYAAVAISSLSATVQSSTGDAIEISLILQQVRVVDAELVEEQRQQAAPGPTDLGTQIAPPADPATEAAAGSILHKLGTAAIGALRGALGGG
jgi:hypothetical protein